MSRPPLYRASPPTYSEGQVPEYVPTDAYGAPLMGVSPGAFPSSGTLTSPSVSASSFSVLPANAARRGLIIENDSGVTIYLLLAAGTASSTNKSMTLSPGDVYEITPGSGGCYTGAINAIGTSATGSLRVTEFT